MEVLLQLYLCVDKFFDRVNFFKIRNVIMPDYMLKRMADGIISAIDNNVFNPSLMTDENVTNNNFTELITRSYCKCMLVAIYKIENNKKK
jgi:hypothetical protein